jgi:hypothetical protein
MANIPINTVALNYNKIGGVAAASAKAHAGAKSEFKTLLDAPEALSGPDAPIRQREEPQGNPARQAAEQTQMIEQARVETKRTGNLSILA